MEEETVVKIISDKFGWIIKFTDRTSFFIDSIYCAESELPKIGDRRTEITEWWNAIHGEWFSGKKAKFVTLASRLRCVLVQNPSFHLSPIHISRIGSLVSEKFKEKYKEDIQKIHGESIPRFGANAYPREFFPEMDELIIDYFKN